MQFHQFRDGLGVTECSSTSLEIGEGSLIAVPPVLEMGGKGH